MPSAAMLSAQPQLRLATIDDAATLSVLGRQTFVETFGHSHQPDDLAAFLPQRYYPEKQAQEIQEGIEFLLLEEGDQTLGYAKIGECKLPIEKTAVDYELYELYVVKAAHGKGYGKLLMDAALEAMRAKGTKRFLLGVWEHNLRAQSFYHRYGFVEIGDYPYPVGKQVDRDLIYMKQES